MPRYNCQYGGASRAVEWVDMRCPVCGRVVRVAGKLSGKRYPREIALKLECCGCHDEFLALVTLVDEDGVPVHTVESAHLAAKARHEAREIRAHHAALIKRTEFVAGGESGDGDGKPLKDHPWVDKEGNDRVLTVSAQQAQAVKMLGKLARQGPALLEAIGQ